MRKRIWIVGFVVLAICISLLLRKTAEQPKTIPQEGTEARNNLTNQPQQPHGVENQQVSNPSRTTAIVPATIVSPTITIAESNAINPQLLAAWQGLIEFYGKVVDENSNPIPDANIQFRWMELPIDDGSRTAMARSDAEGLFALRDQRGLSLGVSVSKEGYHASRRDNDTFNYGSLNGEPFSSSSQNPTVFHLLKKGIGASLVEKDFPPGIGQYVQLRHDGTPVEIDLLNSKKASAGTGQFKLEFWRDVSEKNAKTYDWKLQLSIPSGGLVKTDEEFAFEAPATGYRSSIIIDMPATNQNWQGEIRSRYYIHLADGKYGRIDFYLLPHNGVFTVKSAINLSGSRNLEPAN